MVIMYNRICFASRLAPVGGFDYVRIKREFLKALFLIFPLISYCQIHSQQTLNKELNLNGRIKKVTYDSYLAKMTSKGPVKIEKGWEESEKNDKAIEFNESGNVSKVSYFNKDSKLVRTEKYDYKEGKLIKSEQKYRKSYYYYKDNKLKRVKVFDKTPDVINASNIDEIAGNEKLIIEYIYDSKGRLKEKLENNKAENSQSTTSYFYNDDGLLLKEETSFNDNYKEWNLYEYDSSGNTINKKWFDNEEGMIENEINHYSRNELTSSIWENYSDGELEGKISYKYENGNEVEVIEYDVFENSQIKWEYNYEYDSSNNWIKKVTHTFKDEYYIIYRRIEYY